MKLFNFIKGFCFFDLNKSYSILVIGPIGQDLLKSYFVKNYYYSSITYNIPINLSILPSAVFYFLRILILDQAFFFSKWKIIIYLCLLSAFINKKKIKKIISFALYNNLPDFIQNVLKENIEIIKIQNGVGINNKPFLKSNTNFVYSNKDKIKNKKIFYMGNLRLLLHINSKKLWGTLKQNEFKSSNIVLISSATIDVIKFIDDFFSKSRDEIFNLCKKHDTKNLKADEDWLELRSINFLILCNYLNLYCKKNNKKCKILLRNNKNKNFLKIEKQFFNHLIENCNFLSSKEEHKYNYIIKDKSSLFISDDSTFGHEAFSMNKKSLFFSWCLHDRPNFMEISIKSKLYFIKDSYKKFEKKLNYLKQINHTTFLNQKNKLKKIILVKPSLKELNFFLKTSELKLKQKTL